MAGMSIAPEAGASNNAVAAPLASIRSQDRQLGAGRKDQAPRGRSAAEARLRRRCRQGKKPAGFRPKARMAGMSITPEAGASNNAVAAPLASIRSQDRQPGAGRKDQAPRGRSAAEARLRRRRRQGKKPAGFLSWIKNATRRCGLQLAGVTQRAFIPPPSPALTGQTFVTGRTGRLAATNSPALSGRAPKPCGLGVETLRSPRRRPAGVVSFSNWLSDRSRAKCRDRALQPAIRNIRSRTGIRSGVRRWL